MRRYKARQKRLKQHSWSSTLRYMLICFSTKSPCRSAIKARRGSGMNGMPCSDGVLTIGTNVFIFFVSSFWFTVFCAQAARPMATMAVRINVMRFISIVSIISCQYNAKGGRSLSLFAVYRPRQPMNIFTVSGSLWSKKRLWAVSSCSMRAISSGLSSKS